MNGQLVNTLADIILVEIAGVSDDECVDMAPIINGIADALGVESGFDPRPPLPAGAVRACLRDLKGESAKA